MPQWIAREYISRRGSFKTEHLLQARCSLLGYILDSLKVDGQYIRKTFLQPEMQAEVGNEGYDEGSRILTDFFKREVEKFNTPLLDPLGQQIIRMFLNNAQVYDYSDLIPMNY